MKKFIAIILSVLMIFSCMSVAVSAADSADDSADKEENLIDKIAGTIDFDAISKDFSFSIDGYDNLSAAQLELAITSGLFSDVNVMGINLNSFFNTTEEFSWTGLAVSKDDLTIIKANINSYLAKCVKKEMDGNYTSPNFCNAYNATKITNLIGHILNTDFKDVNIVSLDKAINLDHVYDSFSLANRFYAVIAELSGLTDLMQSNWFDQPGMNYTPILNILGFDYDDDALVGQKELENARRVAPVLVKSVVKTIERIGPLEYLLQIISKISKSYHEMKKPIKALLNGRIATGEFQDSAFDDLKCLFNIVSKSVADGVYAGAPAVEFFSVPQYRFASCTQTTLQSKVPETDTTTMLLYMLIYTNLTGMISGNKEAVEVLKMGVNNSLHLGEEKSVICGILDGFFNGDLGAMLKNALSMFMTNINGVVPSLKDTIMDFFRYFWESIANIYNKIFDSLLNFGKF